MMYGPLCTEFYDADKKYAPPEEIDFYKQIFNKNDFILEPMCGSGCWQYDLLEDNKDPNLIILIVKFSNHETMPSFTSREARRCGVTSLI